MKKLFQILLIIFNITLTSNFQLVYAQEQSTIDSLLKRLETINVDTSKVDLLNDLSNRHQRKNHDKAEYFAMQALNLAKNSGYKKGIASSYEMIGDVNLYIGKYDKAIEYYEKLLKIVKEIGDKRSISTSLNNIGITHYYQSNYDKAIEYFLRSLKFKEEIGDRRGIAGSLNNIGIIYKNQGNSDKALEYYLKSMKISEEIGDKRRISACLGSIGIIYDVWGNYDEAINYFLKSLKIKQEIGDKRGISGILSNIGIAYRNQGNSDKAIGYYSKSLKIAEEIRDNVIISICLNGIGLTYLEQKKYNKALSNFKKAQKIIHEIGSKTLIVESVNFFGELHLKQNNYKKALQYYQQALMANLTNFNDSTIYCNPKELNANSKPLLLRTLSSKAKALYLIFNEENNIKNIETSITTYELVFQLIYIMRNDYSHESTQLLLSETTKNSLADAIQAAIHYNRLMPDHKNEGKAFEYLEKSKSTTLGTYLSDSKMKQHWNISDTILEKEKSIAINRRFYEAAIQKAKAKKGEYDTLLVQSYRDKLFSYSKQYESLINTFKNDYPNYYKLKYEQKVASVKDLQNQLDNKSALINYFVADTTLFIAALTKNSLVYKTIKTDSLFKQKIIDYHIDIKSVFTEDELESSSELYQTLIAPIEELIENKSNLIILPDEHLYYLPFETLCKNGSNLTKSDFLVKNYSISYHHSATLWLNSIEKSKNQITRNESFIGFAPVFDTKTNNGYILSSEWISDTTKTEIATRSISSDLKHFNSLPYSEEEIKSIVKLFGKKKKKAKGYFFREANEENFKQNVSNYNYVHIASHSFANDHYPSLSGIAFSQPDTAKMNKESDEDGILYAGETYNLNIPNADLVVLSSCKSGLGKLIKGEGLLSLSRGFLYSGTPNIVFSLWNVKDEQTKDLMIEFYKQILKGKDYAKALRQAKLKLINNSKTASPKYWAAWILLGK